jgi:glycosyltransferase involved in cell wall biosynthesis
MSIQKSKTIRILMLLGQDFLYPQIDPRVYKEAKSLRQAGFDVTILCLSQRENSKVNFEGINVITLQDKVSLPNLRNKPILWQLPKIIKGIFQNQVNIRQTAYDLEFDIIHANDADTLLFAVDLKKRHKGTKLVYDSHEIATQMASFQKFSPFIKLVERLVSYKVDGFITVNDNVQKYILNLYPRLARNAIIVKNVPNFQPEITFNKVKSPLKIIYQGNLKKDRSSMIRNIIELLSKIDKKRWQLTVLTKKDEVDEDYYKNLPNNIKIRDLIRDIPEFQKTLAEFDMGIVGMNMDCLNSYYSLPNKLFDYMAAGVAVLAPDYPEIAKVVRQSKNGLLFKKERELKKAIIFFLNHPEEINQMKRNGLKSVVEKYNWSIEEKKLIDFYSKI